MQVLEGEHERADPCAGERQGANGLEDARAAGRGVDTCDARVARIYAQEIAQIRDVRVEPTHAPHAVLDLGDDLWLAVELLDAEVASELVDEGQERDRLTERDALALEPGRVLAGPDQRPAELEKQSRLADASVAGDEDDLPAPRLCFTEALTENVQLTLPSHQRREPPLDRGVETRAPASWAQDLVSVNRCAALHRLLA